ncbi:hypothetical protein [Gimesia maris]|uniref:hypothetical protein n=1 Tax=Gimesia maris TaxID=122 RepID=UPI0030DA7564
MKNSAAELQEFRASFEVVSHDHELKSKGAICLLFGSWLFDLALFWIWIKYSGTPTDECMSPIQIAIFMGLYLLPVILFVWYLIRLCSNPRLKCPLCSTPLYNQRKEHLLTTGMCPHCRQIIMAGTLSSAEAIHEYYAEQGLKIKRLEIVNMKSGARISFWSAFLILPLSIPMYYWMKSLEEVLGQETSFRGVSGILIMSVGLILLSVFLKRTGNRLERKLNEKLRQEESAHV